MKKIFRKKLKKKLEFNIKSVTDSHNIFWKMFFWSARGVKGKVEIFFFRTGFQRLKKWHFGGNFWYNETNSEVLESSKLRKYSQSSKTFMNCTKDSRFQTSVL